MGEGLDDTLRRRVETLLEKNEAKDAARDGWVLKMAVRWCVYDAVRSLCFSRGDVRWGLITE